MTFLWFLFFSVGLILYNCSNDVVGVRTGIGYMVVGATVLFIHWAAMMIRGQFRTRKRWRK